MITRNHPHPSPDRAGNAMVAVSVAMTALAVTSLSVLQIGLHSRNEQASQLARVQAQYTAEAALAASMVDLQAGGDGVVFSAQAPLTLGQATAFVGVNAGAGGEFGLVANGNHGNQTFAAEVVTAEVSQSFWQFGAFGDEGVLLDANAQLDSYDSTDGAYADVNGSGSNSYDNANGSVGSNQDIDIASNVKVWGDAIAGPGGTVTVHGDNAKVSGVLTNAPAEQEMPTLVLPALTNYGALTVSGKSGYTLPAGDADFDAIDVGKNTALTIVGPATITCDNFEIGSGSEVYIDDSAGPVTIYVENDFTMNSNTLLAPLSDDPMSLTLNLLSDNILDPTVDVDFTEDLIDFESNAIMYGKIYAPNAEVVIDSNFELYGAVAARLLELRSNSRVHYDENLANSDEDAVSTWEIVGWRVTSSQL